MEYSEIYSEKAEGFNVCPICGKEPKLESKIFFDSLVKENGSACLTVECDTCHIRVTSYPEEMPPLYEDAKKEVQETWNKLR